MLKIAQIPERVIMSTVIIISVAVLIALSIVCITAFMIGAESFEFTTAI